MQSIQNLKENIFSECKNLIGELSQIETVDDLLPQIEKITALNEKTLFLKNFDLFNAHLSEDHSADLKQKDFEINHLEEERETLKAEFWQILEEKNDEISNLTSQLKISTDVILEEQPEVRPKDKAENILLNTYESETAQNISPVVEVAEIIADNAEVFQEQYENEHSELEKTEKSFDIQESTAATELLNQDNSPDKDTDVNAEVESLNIEDRRQIVEFEKKQNLSAEPDPVFEDFKAETVSEKKFRLGKIKGLNMVKSLFDDDLADLEVAAPEEKLPLQKSNMATDFMEAEKPKRDFQIDLNDKVAFTKLLFKGNEDELRSTIIQLNSYKTLDEAKEFLSELYYKKDWQNADDYAQRLWALVENKFI